MTWELLGQRCCPTTGWCGHDKIETKPVWGDRCVHLPSPRVARPTRGNTSSVPWPLAPRAKDLSRLGLSQPQESHPARPINSSDVPEGVVKRTPTRLSHTHTHTLGMYLQVCIFTHRLGTPKSKYQRGSGWLAVPVGLGRTGSSPVGTGQAQLAGDQSVRTTNSPSLFSSPSESSSSLYRYISPSATECLSSVPSPASRRLQVLMMTGMLGSRAWGT